MRLTSRKHQEAPAANRPTLLWPQAGSVVLHVGCGRRGHGVLPEERFPVPEWSEVRLDIDPNVEPDVVANIVAMPEVPDQVADAVWSSHNLEHVFAFEVPLALSEFFRVLRPNGVAHIQVPDLQVPAKAAARGELESTLYESGAGPITALDMFFGYGAAITGGEHFMAHRTGFTRKTLERKLKTAGFADVNVVARDYALWAEATRPA